MLKRGEKILVTSGSCSRNSCSVINCPGFMSCMQVATVIKPAGEPILNPDNFDEEDVIHFNKHVIVKFPNDEGEYTLDNFACTFVCKYTNLSANLYLQKG